MNGGSCAGATNSRAVESHLDDGASPCYRIVVDGKLHDGMGIVLAILTVMLTTLSGLRYKM